MREILSVISTRGPDDEPVCELQWHGESWYAPVADVRVTAQDLITCAAYADLMMHLMATLRLPGETVAALMSDLLSRQRSEEFGTASTITVMPAGSSKRKMAVVLLKRDRGGAWEGEIDTGEARKMAVRFLEVAEATESDQLVSEALGAVGMNPLAQERVFGYLRELRR